MQQGRIEPIQFGGVCFLEKILSWISNEILIKILHCNSVRSAMQIAHATRTPLEISRKSDFTFQLSAYASPAASSALQLRYSTFW